MGSKPSIGSQTLTYVQRAFFILHTLQIIMRNKGASCLVLQEVLMIFSLFYFSGGKFTKLCDSIQLPDDVTIGYIAGKHYAFIAHFSASVL